MEGDRRSTGRFPKLIPEESLRKALTLVKVYDRLSLNNRGQTPEGDTHG
jgi:hypothetical protein